MSVPTNQSLSAPIYMLTVIQLSLDDLCNIITYFIIIYYITPTIAGWYYQSGLYMYIF